ncbi:MAG: hypothetical protein ABIR46_03140 [Candidatus Saccharimonadales bacterium]
MSASDFGLKVSLPGYDVNTATPEQCSVHSSYPPFKAKVNQTNPHFGTLDVDFTGAVTQNLTQTVYSFNHGYSYTPLSMPSIQFYDSTGALTAIGIGTTGVGSTLAINAYATSTQFLVTIYDDFFWTGALARLVVSYYVFAENGA